MAEPEPGQDRSAFAREIWAASRPIANTPAERYLREHRGISGKLPGNLRFCRSLWHKEAKQSFPSLIVGAFGPNGELRVQAIFLNPTTGAKANVKPVKKTFGAGSMPAVFRGAPGGPFDAILCEGLEDAISLRSALETGNVAATLSAGSLHKPEIVAGTRVCIVSDGDAAGAKAAQRAAAEHVIRGCDIRIAVPPDGCKDANELLVKQGPDAVRAMLDSAERFQPAPANGAVVAALSADEASERTRQAIARFFERVMAYVPETPDPLNLNVITPPFVMGIRGTVGLGKTEITLRQLVRPELADKFINYYASTHKLNNELLTRLETMAGPDAPKARVIYGREHVRPDGMPMCQKADLAKSVALLGKKVQTHLCERRHETGEIDPETGKIRTEIERCEHFSSCPYQQQRLDKAPGMRFLSHAHLFIKGAVPRADATIVDESFWQGALHGTDVHLRPVADGVAASGGYYLVLGNLQLPRWELSDGANNDLVSISQRCTKVIYAGGLLKDFQDARVTAEDVKWARGIERSRIEKLAVTPGMPRTRQEDAIKRYRQQEALKFAKFFGLLAECLDAGVDPCRDSLELVRDVKIKDGGLEDRLYLVWCDRVRAPEAPTLLLDADFEPVIARRFFPGLEAPIIAEARLQSYHATQIVDHTVPKARLVPPFNVDADPEETRRRANRRGELRRLVEVEAAKGRTLCVTYLDAEAALRAEGEILNAEFTHWNALRGRDQWRDCDTLILAGVPTPSPETVERMARALWHGDPKPIETIPPDRFGKKRYRTDLRLITLADGTTKPIPVDVHVDSRCTLLLDQIRAETMQGVGRLRLVHRTAGKPARLIILTNYPLPMPVHSLSTWDGVIPDPLAVLEARGIVPEAWRDVATVLADMIHAEGKRPEQAAMQAFKRAGICNIPLYEIYRQGNVAHSLFLCRTEGRRKSGRILVDLSRHPDPRTAVEALFGELDMFEPLEGAADEVAVPPAAPVARQPGWPEPVEEARPQPPQPAAVANMQGISDFVAPELSQPESSPMLAPEVKPEPPEVSKPRPVAVPKPLPPPEPVAFGFIGFGVDEDPDFDEWHGWLGPDPATRPRLVVDNSPPKPPELSDAELLCLLPPKRPGDTAVGWEIAAHDVLRAHRVDWFCAQKLVKEQSAAHDWRPVRDVSAVSMRGSP